VNDLLQESCATAKMTARCAIFLWEPWKFSGLPDYAHGYFTNIFHGLLFRLTLSMCIQNLKSVALPVPEIIGVLTKLGEYLTTPNAHAPFSSKNCREMPSESLCMGRHLQNFKSVVLTVSQTIGIPKTRAVSGYAHAPFSPKFLMDFCTDGPCPGFPFAVCTVSRHCI